MYIVLMLMTTLWLGTIGFHGRLHQGLQERQAGARRPVQGVGQVGLGMIVGAVVYFHPDIRTKVEVPKCSPTSSNPPR